MPERPASMRGTGGSERSAAGPELPVVFAAVLSITATYVYFLIFAEFALLELFAPVVGVGGLRGLMSGLGAGGIAGSLLAAAVFKKSRQHFLLAAAFLSCAASALAAPLVGTPGVACVVAACVGLGCGFLTVTLACVLGTVLPVRSFGLCVGAGTGLAYALCNLPVLFAANPVVQTVTAGLVVLLSSVAALRLAPAREADTRGVEHGSQVAWLWVLIFVFLIWLDSAAFFVIQHTEALRRLTWEGGWVLWGNAFTHLFGALFAGWLVDRGQRALPAWLAAAGLIIACLLLARGDQGPLPRLLYTTGVSLYSTLLVVQAAGPGGPWQAGRLFALAGWVASALGIGMAQDLAGVPVWFLGVAALGIGTGLGLRVRWLARGAALVACVALFCVSGLFAEDSTALIARGRELYIAEGCIHCHSQFVRPNEPLDVERWGPASTTPLVGDLSPPLPGNRRQGPDLARVGNRRVREWQRLHLISPQAVTQKSRMPSYARLFEGDASAGDALLEYLCSLGADTAAERRRFVAAWTPPEPLPAGDVVAGRKLYFRLCSNCHGDSGMGDGVLAGKLTMRPADLRRRPLLRIASGADGQPPVLELVRVINFGVEGTLMAGHEYLELQELADLAALIRALPKAVSPEP